MQIAVTVVYAPRAREVQEIPMQLETGCTAAQALGQSGLLDALTEEELKELELGLWGRKVPGNHVLRADDRLELTRPLTVDPKVARRERFVRQGAKSAGLFAKRRTGGKAGY